MIQEDQACLMWPHSMKPRRLLEVTDGVQDADHNMELEGVAYEGSFLCIHVMHTIISSDGWVAFQWTVPA